MDNSLLRLLADELADLPIEYGISIVVYPVSCIDIGSAAAEVYGHRQVAVAKEKVVIVLTLELAAAVLHKPFLVFAKEMHILVSGDKFVLHREILRQAYPNIGV